MNICQAGHKKHDRVVLNTKLGKMSAFDADKYMGFNGYCTGQDDISRTLINTREWEPIESREIREVLEKGDRTKLFIDVGAHIGWYSRMASQMGYQVWAYEADKENCELLELNSPALVEHVWIGKDTKPIKDPMPVELLKIDIEGNEQYAINMFSKWIKAGKIANIYMEVSPVFNGSYPKLIKELEGYGFKAFEHGEPFSGTFDFDQTNLLFVRQ